jgi:hypothetical protein
MTIMEFSIKRGYNIIESGYTQLKGPHTNTEVV